jgi:hypothetical protein
MATTLPAVRTSLYERDFAAWLDQQTDLLLAGTLAAIDAGRIAGELQAMVNAERRALAGHLKTVIQHLLKWRFQPEGRTEVWRVTIQSARDAIEDILDDSPGLHRDLPALLAKVYRRAVRDAACETGLSERAFPAEWPFTIDDVLSGPF